MQPGHPVVRPEGLEPPTPRSVDLPSIPETESEQEYWVGLRIRGLGVQVPPGGPQDGQVALSPPLRPIPWFLVTVPPRDFLHSLRPEGILGEECHM